MTAIIHNLPFLPPVTGPEPNYGRLECLKCGASAEAKCSCGVGYQHIRAGQRAEKAVMNNPEKSDRALAAEIGVSQPTVLRARRKLADTNVSVEKRIGLDGKQRKAKLSRRDGNYIKTKVPDGYSSLSEALLAGIAVEHDGGTARQAAAKSGLRYLA